jgi:hypothetical protein
MCSERCLLFANHKDGGQLLWHPAQIRMYEIHDMNSGPGTAFGKLVCQIVGRKNSFSVILCNNVTYTETSQFGSAVLAASTTRTPPKQFATSSRRTRRATQPLAQAGRYPPNWQLPPVSKAKTFFNFAGTAEKRKRFWCSRVCAVTKLSSVAIETVVGNSEFLQRPWVSAGPQQAAPAESVL